MRNDGLDLSLLLQVLQALASQRAIDLQSVDQGGDGDETVGLDVLVELLGGGLVENDGVLGLVLDYRQADTMSAMSLLDLMQSSSGVCERRRQWMVTTTMWHSTTVIARSRTLPEFGSSTREPARRATECAHTLALGPLLLLLLSTGSSGSHLD